MSNNLLWFIYQLHFKNEKTNKNAVIGTIDEFSDWYDECIASW